jgi:hypothetical protein
MGSPPTEIGEPTIELVAISNTDTKLPGVPKFETNAYGAAKAPKGNSEATRITAVITAKKLPAVLLMTTSFVEGDNSYHLTY